MYIIGECAEPKQKAQTRKMAAKEQKPPLLRRGRFNTLRAITSARGRGRGRGRVAVIDCRLPWPNFTVSLHALHSP